MSPRSQSSLEPVSALVSLIAFFAGFATGLFSDLRPPGKALGYAAVGLSFAVLGVLLLQALFPSRPPRRDATAVAGWLTPIMLLGAFVCTAALFIYALTTGPRLDDKTLLLTARGQRVIRGQCPAAHESSVHAHVAVAQIEHTFVHIELRPPICTDKREVRMRADDIVAVTPPPGAAR